MIISCPHCQTKYQVTYEAIGATGRKVQCAHCQEAWQQAALPKEEPPPPEVRKAEEVITEDALDEAMASEEQKAGKQKAGSTPTRADKKAAAAAAAAANGAGKIDPAEVRRRQKNFSRRQDNVMASLPTARLRLAARVLAVVALAATGVTFYFGRTQIVERFPSMAGVYEKLGLGVNVVGLQFSDLNTLRTTRSGKELLVVSAQIVGVRSSPAAVPEVVVTLLAADGRSVYQWSVDPLVHDLMAGERATLDTQLSQPPADAVRVRLSFAGEEDEGLMIATPAQPDGHGAVPGAEGHGEAPAEGHGAPAAA
ncbi:MAG: zinc-ribbon domain-containing protein, partial [Alphaproteobacteria bacterium]|nr:zinc-ribbon domain-containing protein [Alphaproteobacteria bacterium]